MNEALKINASIPPLVLAQLLFYSSCGKIEVMKAIWCILVGMSLVSFSNKTNETEIDGFWMGAYGAGNQMETVVVKFNGDSQIEWYKDEVTEKNRLVGSYEIHGDSVLLSYKTPEGKQCTLHGFVNRRKNYVDGNWETSDLGKGSFYLKKQSVTEYFTTP
jgi:hypothetical protein